MNKPFPSVAPVLSDSPFSVTGTSLYVTVGSVVQYRRARPLPRRGTRPGRGTGRDNYTAWPKTLRRAFVADPTVEFDWTLPAAMLSQTIAIDVRRCEAGIENESTGFRVLSLAIDGGGDGVADIVGTAIALEPIYLAGGVVRLRWLWIPGLGGLVPAQFRVVRTAGPTLPADVLETFDGELLVEVETVALDDSAPYTFKIVAENGAVTRDVLTGYVVQPDASGPPAVSSVTSREW